MENTITDYDKDLILNCLYDYQKWFDEDESQYQSIEEVNSINVLANKGIVGDRHFKEFNDPYNQLSLIESENIDYYNIKYGLNIPYIDFRRNVITKGIKLNFMSFLNI